MAKMVDNDGPPKSSAPNLAQLIEAQVPGFKVSIASDDLQRARMALTRSRIVDASTPPTSGLPEYTTDLSAYSSAAAEAIRAAHQLSLHLKQAPQHAPQHSSPRGSPTQSPRSPRNLESNSAASPKLQGSTPLASANGSTARSPRARDGGAELNTQPSDARSHGTGDGDGDDQRGTWQPGDSTEDLMTFLQTESDDFRVQELLAAAAKYTAFEKQQPEGYEVMYNHGLVLQELAVYVATPSQKAALLQQACIKYAAATERSAESHSAPYNHAVALGDLSRLMTPPDSHKAVEYLMQATHEYATAVDRCGSSPQAYNNWGLVLQDLALRLPAEQRRLVIQYAAAKFRSAIRKRPDYDRCCYNLGTVCYASASQMQNDISLLSRRMQSFAVTASKLESPRTVATHISALETEMRVSEGEAYRSMGYAASYIAIAVALHPYKATYQQALAIVRHMLPSQGVLAGPLVAAHRMSTEQPTETWQTCQYLVTHDKLCPVVEAGNSTILACHPQPDSGSVPPQTSLHEAAPPAELAAPLIQMTDVTQVMPCNDPSLPKGFAFWVGMRSNVQGCYFVATTLADAEVWIDVITMIAHIVAQGCQANLEYVLAHNLSVS